MAVDLRLLSYWNKSQTSQAHNRAAARWLQHHTLPDQYMALVERIEQHRKPLHVVTREGAA